MRHGSLFSGIGGFDLAAEWMGWDNVFHCEWNPFGQKVLHHYWPNAIQYHDITKTDFTIHRGTIDILTGGFPCQPYSMAGKRLGKEDERHLWPEMLRAIREIAPRYVVGENVLGLTNWNGGMVFDEVHSDLESAGYEVQAVVIPAAAVNAPHGRDRVWFVAYSNSDGQHRRNSEHEVHAGEGRFDALRDIGTGGEHGFAADAENFRLQLPRYTRKRRTRFEDGSFNGITSDTCHQRLERREECGGIRGSGKERNKQPARCVRTDWQNFPTQSPICGGDDGLPGELDGITFSKWRNESIKAYGNAVVPQVVFQIFKAIENIT
jgi:DNA (cytosine-5)-methyltransferase 1